MDEQWKAVADWPSYEVSNFGRVRSIDRLVPNGHGGQVACKGRLLTPRPNELGYLVVTLRQGQKINFVARVHRLVATAFLPNPCAKPYVNHLDCNTGNPHVENLEWCTQAENLAHAHRLGRMCWGNGKGKRSFMATLTDDQVRQLRLRYASGGVSIEAIGKQFGVSKRTAGRVIHRKSYAYVQTTQGQSHGE